MIVKIPSLAIGVDKDSIPEDLPLGVWSDCSNVTFKNGIMERAPGMAQLFAAPAATPYYVGAFRTGTQLLWLHATLTRIYADDGTTRTDITRAAGVYTGTAADRWTGGAFNGVYLLNNGVDVPQYFAGSVGTPFIALPAWPAGYKCMSLRPWRNYVFALGITKAGTYYPNRVLWSSVTDPGATPPTWDITDATHDAGEVDLAETPDVIVDALPLGDGLVIYKSSSMHLARWVGGQSVFAFSRLPGDVGMLARGCAVNTPVGHVVMTLGDVILHAGAGPKSIADGRVRRAIFTNIDRTYAERVSFVVANPVANEVWVCYPEDGNSSCNRAAVWNWKDDAWTFRELRQVTAGGTGQTPTIAGLTWATTPYTWATDPTTWGDPFANQNDTHLVLSHATPALSLVGSGTKDLGLITQAMAERVGMSFDDAQTCKLLRRAWPQLEGAEGTVVGLQFGASMRADVQPTWQPVVQYTIGTSQKVDVFARGRYISMRILSQTDAPWRLKSMSLDIVPAGLW